MRHALAAAVVIAKAGRRLRKFVTKWRWPLAVLALIVIISGVSSREPYYPPFQVGIYDGKFIATGVIQSGSASTLRTMVNWYPRIRTLVLLRVPGSIDFDNNWAMVRLIREAGLTTVVPAHGLVASGGTDLFIAGTERRMEQGACIGVHSWEEGYWSPFGTLFSHEGRDADPDDPNHARYLRELRRLGMPSAFYWFALKAAPHDGMHWMSVAEVERFKLATSVQGVAKEPDDNDCQNRIFWGPD